MERAAANEDAFRKANEEIARARQEFELEERRTPYLCECEDERCTDLLLLAVEDYEFVRSSPRRFVVYPGHESEGEIPVAEGDGFRVIEKTGEEGDLVEQKARRT